MNLKIVLYGHGVYIFSGKTFLQQNLTFSYHSALGGGGGEGGGGGKKIARVCTEKWTNSRSSHCTKYGKNLFRKSET